MRIIELSTASNAARAKPDWRTIKSGIGWVGTIIKCCRYSPRGSSTGPCGEEKIRTPALTVPQTRELIAVAIEEQLQANTLPHKAETAERWLVRNELARAARYKSRNLLPPKRKKQSA